MLRHSFFEKVEQATSDTRDRIEITKVLSSQKHLGIGTPESVELTFCLSLASVSSQLGEDSTELKTDLALPVKRVKKKRPILIGRRVQIFLMKISSIKLTGLRDV